MVAKQWNTKFKIQKKRVGKLAQLGRKKWDRTGGKMAPESAGCAEPKIRRTPKNQKYTHYDTP